jgi:hypothetical protein
MANKAELVQPTLFPILKVLQQQVDKIILQTATLTSLKWNHSQDEFAA